MSTGRPNPWTFDRQKLRLALGRFKASEPDEATKRAVYDWLIDCYRDPLRAGGEDPPDSGIFYRRVFGTHVGVLYTVDPTTGRILIVEISEER